MDLSLMSADGRRRRHLGCPRARCAFPAYIALLRTDSVRRAPLEVLSRRRRVHTLAEDSFNALRSCGTTPFLAGAEFTSLAGLFPALLQGTTLSSQASPSWRDSFSLCSRPGTTLSALRPLAFARRRTYRDCMGHVAEASLDQGRTHWADSIDWSRLPVRAR
jgi:hypothetical protein